MNADIAKHSRFKSKVARFCIPRKRLKIWAIVGKIRALRGLLEGRGLGLGLIGADDLHNQDKRTQFKRLPDKIYGIQSQ